MKKVLCSLLLVATFLLGLSVSPQPVFAQVACCNEGSTYVNGECHPSITADGCGLLSEGLCRIGTYAEVPGCSGVIERVCQESIAAGGNVGCGTFATTLNAAIRIGTVGAGLPFIGRDEILDACQDVLGDGDISGSTFDSNCGDDETCNSANFCVSRVPFELCKQIPETNSTSRSSCEACAQVDEVGNVSGIWTAIGCVETDPTAMVQTLMKIMISISGGVALLMILSAGFMFSTSQGDPKKVSEAKELMTSAVIGLLFIIFSVTILQFIGVTILKIPGFGG